MKRMIAILFGSVLGSACCCQDTSLPDGRASASLIYDPLQQEMLLIDGYQIHLDSNRNDVWSWNGKTWRRTIAYGPGSRSLSAAAFLPGARSVAIFGGIGKNNYDDKKSDAWMFRENSWRAMQTNDIGTRDHHEMIYVENLNALLLYGGLNAKREFDSTTWLLEGDQFVPLQINGPGSRYHFAMAYDPSRRKVVLYGGGKPARRKELWEFDGKNWAKIRQDGEPGSRLRHSMTYDENLKMVLLHGGDDSGITWGWNGRRWQKVATGGPPGHLIALAYFPPTKATLAFGGSGDNTLNSGFWELKNGHWKKLMDNGNWKWVDDKLQRMR